MKKLNLDNSRIIFYVFAGCVIAAVFIIISAFTFKPEEYHETLPATFIEDFDDNGDKIFSSFDDMADEYLKGSSTDRTLAEFYSRRQYPDSPPIILHPVVETFDEQVQCLACHESGGWSEELKRNTPITPHPEHTSCRQCHVRSIEEDLFVENRWESVPPPRLGGAHLPGAPAPVPHSLLMRGNCVPCHVGPGAVTEIRVEHPLRGNCRQCHVPVEQIEPFKRGS